MIDKVEADFHAAMLGVYHSALKQCGYRATRFLQMVNERGGLDTAKLLLRSEGYSEGLTALWEKGRLDLSMEALVLGERWSTLFSADELAVARKRLIERNFLLPPKSNRPSA